MSKKRDGTSGVGGQLYESKLISLIHFRAKFDDNIKDYNLASNIADIGTFDDICIRAKVKLESGYKPVAVFIQAKHMEKIALNSKKDLAKWFSSYLSIRRLFKPSNGDVMFNGEFEATECFFVMYTNANANLNSKVFESDFAEKLNGWIGTAKEGKVYKGLQLRHTDEDIVYLCKINLKEQFSALAVQLAKFLSHNTTNDIMPMCDELVLRYHVILAKSVLDVSDIKCKHNERKHRVASFQTDFFKNDDEFLKLFKDTLLNEMLRIRKLEGPELNSLLSKLYENKKLNISALSSLIGNIVTFNDKKFKLQFVVPMPDDSKRELEKVDIQQSQINEAIELALLTATDNLKKINFNIPVTFGNKDLMIRGNENNVEPSIYITSVIDELAKKILNLIMATPMENIITIEENKKIPNLHSGLAGTIGNLLVCDDEHPKYAKFATCDKLGTLAKTLYNQVLSHIPNLHNYKFHIKDKSFPKLSFFSDDDENLEMLKDQVTALAKLVTQRLCEGDDSIVPMKKTQRYHVLMAQKAVEVSEIQFSSADNEHRLASFRQEFFESDDKFVILFKKALHNEILTIRNVDEKEIDLVAKEILTSRQFIVPIAFGNKDLTIKKSKTERRLDHLKSKISELFSKTDSDKIVTLDESLESGLLELEGGLAGIVGNILVFDEDTTLMKFTDNSESLGEISKMLFEKLQSGIENLHDYKFRVKVNKFPKLSFKKDKDDENLARDFLERLLFFTNQADEKGVENLLKYEIEKRHSRMVDNVRVTADAIFLQYHDSIQRWWMLKEVSYLTKGSKIFEDSLELIVGKTLKSIIGTKLSEMKVAYKYDTDNTFNENPIDWVAIMAQPPTVIFVTDGTLSEYTKVSLSLAKIEYSSFDLELYFKSSETVFKDMIIDLRVRAYQNKLLIFFYERDNISSEYIARLEQIASIVVNKRSVFWVNKILVNTIMEALYRK